MDLQDQIKRYVKHVPFEGDEIDTIGIECLIESYLKKMITFSHTFQHDEKGYHKDGRYYSKGQMLYIFLNTLK